MELSNPTAPKDIPLTTKLLYSSHFVEVLGSRMHYLDEGQGEPLLFLHGIPTWSYLWRNIIPAVADVARCVAPDLIGMGKSDKPDIAYRIFDHIRYIEAFIEKLNLKNITLVLHGWGSVIGFDIAMRQPEKFKGIAFLESYLRPMLKWEEMSLPLQEVTSLLHLPDRGKDLILNNNYFVEKGISTGTVRKLSEEELQHYRDPFLAPESRKPIWQFLQDVPVPDGPKDVIEMVERYGKKLKQSSVEKLMLFAMPGFITPMQDVKWACENFSNLTVADIGDGHHYVPEGNPIDLRNALRKWYLEKIYSRKVMS